LDFEIVECGGSKVLRRGVPIREFGKRIELKRDADGLRIRVTDRLIEVEVSFPRVLGLLNDEQDKMTESDVCRAVRMVTTQLFPRTTYRARVSGVGGHRRRWHITRIDLAVNFRGRVQEYVETYRRARLPRSSTAKRSEDEGEALRASLPWYQPETGTFAIPRGEAARVFALAISVGARRARQASTWESPGRDC